MILNFCGLRKTILVKINKPPNKITVSNFKFILKSNINMQSIQNNNRNNAVKMANKVQDTSLFPKIALSGTKE